MRTGRLSSPLLLLAATFFTIAMATPLAARASTDAAGNPDHFNIGDSSSQSQMALSYGVALTSTLAFRKSKLALTDSLFFSTILTLGILTAKELSGDHQPTAGAHVANALGVGANVLIASAIEF